MIICIKNLRLPSISTLLNTLYWADQKRLIDSQYVRDILFKILHLLRECAEYKEVKMRGRQRKKTEIEKQEEEVEKQSLQQSRCITIYLLSHVLVLLTQNACIELPNTLQLKIEEIEELQQAVESAWKRDCLLSKYPSLWRKCRFELIVTPLRFN